MHPDLLPITAQRLASDVRSALVPRFGAASQQFEDAVHRSMRVYCGGFDGGPWFCWSLSNRAVYVAPESDEVVRVRIDAARPLVGMSSHAAGIVATLLAYCELCGHANLRYDHATARVFAVGYDRVRAFASGHVEADAIAAAID